MKQQRDLEEERDLFIHNYRLYHIDMRTVTEGDKELWETTNPHVFISNSLLKPLQFKFTSELSPAIQELYSLAAGIGDISRTRTIEEEDLR